MSKDKDNLIKELCKIYFRDNNKIRVLQQINREDTTTKKIANRIGLSSPLVSYHILGNKNTLGLVELRFIERIFLNPLQTKFRYKITQLGRDVLKILGKNY